MDTTATQLQRYGIRREGGLPLPLVLEGSADAAEAAWWARCREQGRTPIRVECLLERGLVALYFELASSHAEAYGHLAAWLAARSRRDVASIAAVLEDGGPGERRLLARQAGLIQAEGETAQWARAVVLEEPGYALFQDDRTGDGATALSLRTDALAALFGAVSLPALFVSPAEGAGRVAWLRSQLCHGERMLAAGQALMLAIAVDPVLAEAFLAEVPECREKALFRAVRIGTAPLQGRAPAVVDGGALFRSRRYVETLGGGGPDKGLQRAFRKALQSYGGPVPAAAKGGDRARSRQEALLYAALEAHPRTRGRFGLNALAQTPDPALAELEVDFVCTELGIALEVDGYHHFQAPERYRRDRQRDVALQQAGYLVERFLAEDVAPRLEWIMNRVVRLMDWREKGKQS